MTDFEIALRREIQRIRELCAGCDDIHGITFRIEASGRVRDGDMNVSFWIDEHLKTDVAVKGGQLNPTINEFIRRLDWTAANAPLCLPASINSAEEP